MMKREEEDEEIIEEKREEEKKMDKRAIKENTLEEYVEEGRVNGATNLWRGYVVEE